MNALLTFTATSSRTLSLLLGTSVIALALTAASTGIGITDIASWAMRVLGMAFIGLLAGLIFMALFCWVRLVDSQRTKNEPGAALWLESGLHAANGVATLALTFTLLGISLGIGTLADQELNHDTVQGVIRGLTEHFSLAFMTTVIGLPAAAVLRALLGVTGVRHSSKHPKGEII